ncbi:hypothetical protein HYH02_008578 [Chlamydomonas schloesseri]|uniref:Uncharacterized protein n=1 Tax=Chlamydomonas schloesseri TaxID=2026947 RepID=A0A835WFP2_9CHLO|nr:hypothetical protein HYH02_008578 [Chlamydomonas schloesseri]|eukprot:KAG2446593.1 hypothetical protein HYH02_008578 [Chlamydomonas schloesseri]
MALAVSSNSSHLSTSGRGLHDAYLHGALPASELAGQAGARLLFCAASGDVHQAARCLADGADRDYQDPSSGETALHRAAQRGQVAMLEVLLAAGANPHVADRGGCTPLFTAANAGSLAAVHALLAYGAALFPAATFPASCGCAATTSDRSSSCCCSQPHQQQQHAPPPATATTNNSTAGSASPPSPSDEEADDAAFLALRTTCPLAAAAAAARWPVVAALLSALPHSYQQQPAALRSLRFLVWALASHKAFPREVISRLPRRLPACVLNAVRPATLASTPLVLAAGNDQQQLMQWLLRQGADPELGAPLLLCAGRFCRGSRACCVNTLLRLGAAPHVAWADNPSDSPLMLAARGDCFTHVHCLVAHGADVGGEAARVRAALYAPAPWEPRLEALLASPQAAAALAQHAQQAAAGGGEEWGLLCPCGQSHAAWPGLWPADEPGAARGATGDGVVLEGEEEATAGAGAGAGARGGSREGGEGGNSCHNPTPSDDAWYRHHRLEMEQLQDGAKLADCRKAVDDLWAFGCSAVSAEVAAAAAVAAAAQQQGQQQQPVAAVALAPHSPLPSAVLGALGDVAGGWLVAAARCRQQRLLRADLYDKAVGAGLRLLERKRLAALAALGGAGLAAAAEQGHEPLGAGGALAAELKMEILALAGLAPPGVTAGLAAAPRPARRACGCDGCCSGNAGPSEAAA